MAINQMGWLRPDLALPDGTQQIVKNWAAMLDNSMWCRMIAAFGGSVASRYFYPGMNARFEYDANDNLEQIVMWNPSVAFGWRLIWDDPGGGYRPTDVLWFLDDGTAREPIEAPAGFGIQATPDIGEAGGGLSFIGYHTYSYGGPNPDDLTGASWTPAVLP